MVLTAACVSAFVRAAAVVVDETEYTRPER
jgi:hypothetical protein